MSGTAATSITPILDLELPFPPKRRQLGRRAFGFFVGFASTIAFFAMFEKDEMQLPYLWLVPIAALLLAVLMHELGHLLAGWSVGFHFNSIQIAWFSLAFESGKLRLRVRREMPVAGYASVQIDRVCRLRKRLMVFIAGGPAANMFSVVGTAILVNALDLNGSWVATPAAAFAYISLLLSLASLAPISGRGYWTDGARLESLLTSREKARRWFCIAALANAFRNGKAPKAWSSTWTAAAVSIQDGSMDEISSCWLGYLSASDRKQVALAAARLERCLELVGLTGPTTRDILAMEGAVFQAWERDDVDKAEKWLARVKAPTRLPRLSQLRPTIALDCARRNYESANTRWEEGKSLIEKLPATKVREVMIASWSEWRTEIHERQEAQVSAAQN